MYIDEYEEQFYEGLERGEARAKGIKRALDYALEQQDVNAVFQLYYLFMNEDVMHGNSYQAIVLFPEYVAYFDEHPDYQEDYVHDMMWTYKWIIGNIHDFCQIPKQQIESIFSQYCEFCKKYNYNLRSYYECLTNYIIYHLGADGSFCGLTAKQAHDEMLKCKRDSLSNCVACETASEIEYLIMTKAPMEDVIKAAEPLINGKMSCAEQPHCTFANIAEYYLESGDLKNADRFANKSYHLINRDYSDENNLTGSKSICMTVFAHSDINKAIKILKNLMRFVEDNSNGNDLFELYRGAYYFMSRLDRKGASTIRLKLPFRDEDIINDENIYKITDLKELFYSKAKDIAEKFDERNGSTVFTDRLEKINDVNEEEFQKDEEMPDYSLLSYIRENLIDGFLPDGFSLPSPKVDDEGGRYADGAFDGIMLFHTEVERKDIGELADIIKKAARGAESAYDETVKYFEETKNNVINLVDNLLNYIITNQELLDPNNMFSYAVDLVVDSNNKECVKAGLCILSLFSTLNDKLIDAILDISACDEFTLYCVWAVEAMENSNELTFEMAKRANGWGRINAVDRLAPETDEIKEWLLYEGIRNTVYPGYSSIVVFKNAGVMELLEKGLTAENISPVGLIITFLILDGPTIGIKAFGEDEEKIMDMFMTAAEKLELSDFDKRSLQLILSNYDNEDICARIRALGIEPEEEAAEEE